MKEFVQKAMDMTRWMFSPWYQKEVEKYLSESVDLADLEARLRIVRNRGLV